jgi:sensor domain CHASE-containing protein
MLSKHLLLHQVLSLVLSDEVMFLVGLLVLLTAPSLVELREMVLILVESILMLLSQEFNTHIVLVKRLIYSLHFEGS